MGERADDFLNDVVDHEMLRLSYKLGDMTNEEAYDAGLVDEYGCTPDEVGEQDSTTLALNILLRHLGRS